MVYILDDSLMVKLLESEVNKIRVIATLTLYSFWVGIRLNHFVRVYTPPKISRTRHGMDLKFSPVIPLEN